MLFDWYVKKHFIVLQQYNKHAESFDVRVHRVNYIYLLGANVRYIIQYGILIIYEVGISL